MSSSFSESRGPPAGASSVLLLAFLLYVSGLRARLGHMILPGPLSGMKPTSSKASPNILACVTVTGSGFSGLSVFPVTFVPPECWVTASASCLPAIDPTSDLVWILTGVDLTVSGARIRRRHWNFRIGSGTDIPRPFGTSGFLRIAAYGLTSQVCQEATFRDCGSVPRKDLLEHSVL